ncbi:MAG: winged helix-turn-helix transcriptional regulator [Anaerolineae bacterium]
MLQQILEIMASGDAMTQRELAQKLNVPEPLVAQMVGQLVRRGYLREGGECTISCDSCKLKAACGALSSPQVWTLTEKGWRAAQR